MRAFYLLLIASMLLISCRPESGSSTAITPVPQLPSIVPTEAIRGYATSARTPEPLLVSTIAPGVQGNNYSDHPRLSADGRFVAFQSMSSNLVAGDTNNASDIFVHDRQTGITQRVSVASDGTQSNGNSIQPSLSADGRWIAFTSFATNLALNDSLHCPRYKDCSDIFVHDRLTGKTERISVASDGALGDAPSYSPSISADGRYIVFVSLASNLVPDDTNGVANIFVHDRLTGKTERVSVASDGAQISEYSDWPGISADGSFVAFGSAPSTLTTEKKPGVFVRDRKMGTTKRVGNGFAPNVSVDGRWVAFLDRAVTDGWIHLFVYDYQTNKTVDIRKIVMGIQGRPSNDVSLSADGRLVAFWAVDIDSQTGTQKTYTDVFIYDQQTRTTKLVSTASDGSPANGGSGHPYLSLDGRFIAFDSNATNLVPGDTNQTTDVFVHDLQTGKTERVSVASSK